MSDIAIVGVGCRYAGGIDSPEAFWDFVVDKRDAVVDVPVTRWDYRRFYDPERRTPGRAYTKRGAFLTDDPWAFDPEFFGISVREARSMDPQQRLIMEVAWDALDDAGVAGRVAGEAVGVYVGAFAVDQMMIAGALTAHMDMHTAASASYTMLSNRLAYALNLTGPALTVDTACSSSLVAFHLACQALDGGDCDVALAGGVNVMLRPETFVMMCKGGFLSADGRCKSFDASADGYGRGEGAGMVVLKRLDDAERAGDRIYAVVKATGSNQDGRTTAITVPNADAQARLARQVCARAGIAPAAVDYVEAHGTGTPVGDPVELAAIGQVYGMAGERAGTLGVGSVKATLGHTEAASGIASVIKASLAIQHRTLPPQGWLEQLNPDIPFDDLRLHIQTQAQPAPSDAPMTVAVNGFGYGGTNAHALLQEYRPAQAPVSVGLPMHRGVYPLSARSAAAVRELAGRAVDLLDAGADSDRLADAAWARMAHHPYRAAVSFADRAELVNGLASFAAGGGRDATRAVARLIEEPVFVFSGMGPQWWAMGRGLLEAGGAFAAEAAVVDAVFGRLSGWSIIEELLREEDESRVTATHVAQPANFLLQASLCAELAELGIRPAAVIGHSVGEVTAAYVAGVLPLEDAVAVAYHRARLQASTAGVGGMLAVGLPADQVDQLLAGRDGVDIAAVNSASAVTLSGDMEVLEDIADELADRGVFARMLRVEVPYHSRLMDPILPDLRTALTDIAPKPPALPLYSTVTGEQVLDGYWDAEYWCANVRRPVRFAAAIGAAVTAGSRVFLEVGPHPVLSGNIREILLAAGETGTTVATLHRNRDDRNSLRETQAGLYVAGVLDDAEQFPADAVVPHVTVPRYPWQRSSLQLELPVLNEPLFGAPGAFPMLGDPDPERPGSWTLQIGVETLPWIVDHVVGGLRILPGAAYLDAALSAASSRLNASQVALENVRFVAPLVMAQPDVPVVKLDVEESNGRFVIRSRSATGTSWTVHAIGRIVAGVFDPPTVAVPSPENAVVVDRDGFYRALAGRGLHYGPAFALTTSLRKAPDLVVSTVDGTVGRESGHLAHPAVVDCAMQSVAMLFTEVDTSGGGALVPVGVSAVRLYRELPRTVTVTARRDSSTALRADVDLLDADGAVCLRLLGVEFGAITPGRGPLQQMVDFFYTNETIPGPEVPADLDPQAATTLVVTLGANATIAGTSAHALTDALASRAIRLDTEQPDLEETLRAAAGDAAQVHVVVVAGAVDDDVAALWQLRQLAVALTACTDPEYTDDVSWHVTLVTRRAFATAGDPMPPDPGHAALAGARRVLLNEQLGLRWRLIDTDDETALDLLLRELSIPGAFFADYSDEVYLRGGQRLLPRVTRSLPQRLEALDTAVPLEDSDADFVLEVPASRVLTELAWRQDLRRDPAPGEVEVRMQFVGLNYKDAMKVLGVLGEREMEHTFFGMSLGMEGTGTVVRIGEGVDTVAVGDRVAVLTKDMLRRFVTVDTAELLAIPPRVDPGICTSVTPFITAHLALIELARLQAGETVLVHGAAGSVGSAAVQVARTVGARVIGTASTPQRREHVRECGADHVLNSRSLDFAAEVAALTDGRGADVVISSAPGEILRHNFAAVAEGGRIVEVGKADIYGGGLLELANFDKNLSFISVDLDRLLATRPDRFAELSAHALLKMVEGIYPPLPYTAYPPDEVGRAFEDVARSGHMGRIAVDLAGLPPAVRPPLPEFVVHADACYLVTGGFGGFGLATAAWLVSKGARHLMLMGRRGPVTEDSRRLLAIWRALGVEVVEERIDVTDREAVAAAVARAHGSTCPLRGIFHAAGAVADNRIAAMSRDEIERVYRPKVDGARAIEAAVRAVGVELDVFVLYSSGGSTFGIVGQFNYNAANVAVEAFAERLAREGMPVVCVGWGHLAGVGGGMAADSTTAKYLCAAGFDPIDMADATSYLEQTIRLGITRAAIIPTDFGRLSAAFPHFARVGRVAELVAESAESSSANTRLAVELAGLDGAARGKRMTSLLAEQLAAVMGVSADAIDPTVSVAELGLDSLMAVEFGARVTRELGVEMMALQLGRNFSLEQVGPKVAERVVAAAGLVA